MQLWCVPIFPGPSCPNAVPQQIMTDMVPPIMGIAFNIIIGSCFVYAKLSNLNYFCLVRIGLASSKCNSTSKTGANTTVIFTQTTNNIAYPLDNLTETTPPRGDDKRGNALDHRDFEYA